MDVHAFGPLNPATIAAAQEFLPTGELVGWRLLVEHEVSDQNPLYLIDDTYREIEGALLRYPAGKRTAFPLADYGSVLYRVDGIDFLLVADKTAPELILSAAQLRAALNFDPASASTVIAALATVVGTIFPILVHVQAKRRARRAEDRRIIEARVEERTENSSRLVIAIARSLPPQQSNQSIEDYVALIKMLYPVSEPRSETLGGLTHGRMH
jgi:hypothetical protein